MAAATATVPVPSTMTTSASRTRGTWAVPVLRRGRYTAIDGLNGVLAAAATAAIMAGGAVELIVPAAMTLAGLTLSIAVQRSTARGEPLWSEVLGVLRRLAIPLLGIPAAVVLLVSSVDALAADAGAADAVAALSGIGPASDYGERLLGNFLVLAGMLPLMLLAAVVLALAGRVREPRHLRITVVAVIGAVGIGAALLLGVDPAAPGFQNAVGILLGAVGGSCRPDRIRGLHVKRLTTQILVRVLTTAISAVAAAAMVYLMIAEQSPLSALLAAALCLALAVTLMSPANQLVRIFRFWPVAAFGRVGLEFFLLAPLFRVFVVSLFPIASAWVVTGLACVIAWVVASLLRKVLVRRLQGSTLGVSLVVVGLLAAFWAVALVVAGGV